MKQFLRFAGFGTVLLVLIGCSKVDQLGVVTGTITLDGQPLSDAMVQFEPLEGNRSSAGRTDEQGHYELIYTRDTKGAVTGEHVVRISTFDELASDDASETIEEVVPARYNMRSDLRAQVKRGANSFDFALDSTGEIIEPNPSQPDASQAEPDPDPDAAEEETTPSSPDAP